MSQSVSRRKFLAGMGVAGAALAVRPRWTWGQATAPATVRLATIGAGGMGGADLQNLSACRNVKVVALCDVDANRLKEAANKHPGARTYSDWRELLEKEEKEIDAVNVGTPDHTHAPAAMSAILRGKHVYCQKPLTHEIHESRQLLLAARKQKVITQMGIQCHSDIAYRQAVQIVRDGPIGKIKEVHVWSSDRPGWPQGKPRPEGSDAVPAELNWDLWLGVAPQRPFRNGVYHPGAWRGFLDFGTGALGDMGCHILDTPVAALKLGAPISVQSEGPGCTDDMHPAWEIVRYEYAGTEYTADKVLPMTWYDGGHLPDPKIAHLEPGQKLPASGALFIGEKGVILLPHIGGAQLLPAADFRDYKRPQLPPANHWEQWINACRGQGETSAPFEYAAPLTEAVLLGTLSARFVGKKLEWDSPNLKISGVDEANRFIRRAYRDGWKIEGLS